MTEAAQPTDLMCRIAQEAGRLARDKDEPRKSNPLRSAVDTRRAWFTGWDLRDQEIEAELLGLRGLA